MFCCRRVLSLIVVCVSPALVVGQDLPEPRAETKALFERWAAEARKVPDKAQEDHPLYKQLLAAPDADLCFLVVSRGGSDAAARYSGKALGRLNTPRTFAAVVADLEHPEPRRREWAVSVLFHFPPDKAAPLAAKRLTDDPTEYVRTSAASVLESILKPDNVSDAVRSALRRTALDPHAGIAFRAVHILGKLGDPEARAVIERRLEEARADGVYHAVAVHTVARQRNKAAVEFLLRELAWLSDRDPQREQHVTGLVVSKLTEYYRPPVDRFRPTADPPPSPETLEQWQDWWAKTAPTVNDDLSPKRPPPDMRKYLGIFSEEAFGEDPAKVMLTASVDAPEYRVGDPIRLTLRMRNNSDRPCRLYLPFVPAHMYGTMAYGVRLTRDGKRVVDLPTSNQSERWGYRGPPDWEVLLPGESFEDSTCLQAWLERVVDLPLAEGEYVLSISFDPSEYAGMPANAWGLLHRWDAAPVKFRVRGPAREDPIEMLEVIAQKAGLEWLHEDLHGQRTDRRDVAWRAIHAYGDARLRPFLEEFEKEHPEKRYHDSRPAKLRPFERHLDAGRP